MPGLADGFDLDATYPEINVYGVDFSLMMQKIQQDLVKVGINLELTPVQFPEWADRINAEGIPVTAVYFAPDHTDPSQYIQYFGEIPGSSWASRGRRRRCRHATRQPEGVRAVGDSAGIVGRCQDRRHTRISGSQMIDRRHHRADRQSATRAGHGVRHHRHALQRMLQPRSRFARSRRLTRKPGSLQP